MAEVIIENQIDVDILKKYINFQTLNRLMHSQNLPTFRSWNDLQEKIKEGNSQKIIEGLSSSFEEYKIHGQKSVFIYKLNSEEKESLKGFLENLSVQEKYQKSWPYPINDDEYIEDADEKPILTAIKKYENGIAYVFCSRGKYNIREEIPLDWIEEKHRRNIFYEKIYGTKDFVMQMYDVLFIPHDLDTIEFRMDKTLKQRKNSNNLLIFQNTIKRLSLEQHLNFGESINFFDAIDKIYNNDDEGKVVEIHFECTTAVGRHEKRKRGPEDLRKELYHKAGKEAVGSLQIYRISIEWDQDEEKNEIKCKLVIPGNSRMIHGDINCKNKDKLYEIRVEEARFRSEFEYVIKRIREYL